MDKNENRAIVLDIRPSPVIYGGIGSGPKDDLEVKLLIASLTSQTETEEIKKYSWHKSSSGKIKISYPLLCSGNYK